MKFIGTLLLCLALSARASALELPTLRGHVNDYANMLTKERSAALEGALTSFEQSDSTQIVVLTVPTLGGENLEEFSIRVAESWKIGQKGVDNGVILLIAKAERKVRIEVGRGLEGKLTDLVSGRIIRADIAPRFKAGDFDGGIDAGVKALIAVVKGEYQAAPRDLHQGKKGAPPLLTLLVFLAVAAVFLSSFSRYLAGAAGAVGLPVIAWLTFPGLALAVMAGLAVGGFLLGLLLALLFSSSGSGGGHFGGPFSGGGFYGGGGGGGGDSGGFSGGGGDFGGGGASGDW
jgi:uncharacterized protein